MLILARGNLLKAHAEALVNTINTKGVMGAGIALQFKKAYPEMFSDYRTACREGRIKIGKMHVFHRRTVEFPHYIINFPTKDDWKQPSKN